MFRKKDPDAELPAGGEGTFRRAVGDTTARTSPQPEPLPRKSDLASGSAGSTVGGQPAEPRAAPPQQTEPDRYGGKRLIVGEGIRLSGEISSCDRLVVEGEVEVTLNDTLALEITAKGRFTGGCEVEEADISGVYEGDLTVRRRLFVRGSGKLTGTVRYGELELERGGQIAGNISVLSAEATGGGHGSSASDRRSPAFGETAAAGEASA
ncbi:MAG: bactofilin family protein, partial [Geminicoccales bacterium]